ncbi:MAG: hypothetical protein SVU32_00660, partial [Candidatus Nanohaloarchaea archaeon]|nr:hypothetical protein [Candidatus Nanohaloarchaea archaeon]
DVDVDTVDIHVPDAVEPGDSFSIKMDVSIDSGDSHYEIVELQAYLAGKKQEHFLGKRTFPYWNVPGGHAPVDLTYEVPVSGETV